MIGFMTRRDLGLVFGFVEEKSTTEGDGAVTVGFRGFFLGSRWTFTAIPGGLARFFCDVARIAPFQGVLKAESGMQEAEMGGRDGVEGGARDGKRELLGNFLKRGAGGVFGDGK